MVGVDKDTSWTNNYCLLVKKNCKHNTMLSKGCYCESIYLLYCNVSDCYKEVMMSTKFSKT